MPRLCLHVSLEGLRATTVGVHWQNLGVRPHQMDSGRGEELRRSQSIQAREPCNIWKDESCPMRLSLIWPMKPTEVHGASMMVVHNLPWASSDWTGADHMVHLGPIRFSVIEFRIQSGISLSVSVCGWLRAPGMKSDIWGVSTTSSLSLGGLLNCGATSVPSLEN